jgi:hypothetical protein
MGMRVNRWITHLGTPFLSSSGRELIIEVLTILHPIPLTPYF